MALITVEDLLPFAPDIDRARAQGLIDDATALALQAAPCLGASDLDPIKASAARAVLRQTVLRWNDEGSGALASQTLVAGPFTQTEAYDTRAPRRGLLRAGDVALLRSICGRTGAFSIGLGPELPATGQPWRVEPM